MVVFSLFALLMTLALAQDELLLVQLVNRHGAKVPDNIPVGMEEFWAQFGAAGHLTVRGEEQMRAMGQLLRDRYIENERLLPSDYDQNLLHVRASSWNSRPLRSSEAAIRALYPDASVPVYSTSGELEDLVAPFGSGSCPSFGAETPLLHQELSDFIDTNYTDLITGLREIYDFGNPDLPSAYFVGWGVVDQWETAPAHGVTLPDFVIENEEALVPLMTMYWDLNVRRQEPYDPRGVAFQVLGREMISNIQAAIDGTSPVKMYLYSDHGTIIAGTQSILGVHEEAADWRYFADAIVLELRRNAQQEYYVRAEFWRPEWLPDYEGAFYNTRTLLLNCPAPHQQVCAVNPWLDYVRNRSPPFGCCEKTRAFTYFGCDDYLNPDVLNIEECMMYRKWCPQVACGPNQVLDKATLRCFRIATK